MSLSESRYYEATELWGYTTDAVQVRLEATVSLIPDDIRSILDVGAGDGALLELVKENRADTQLTVALERSREAIRHVGTTRVLASSDAIPFRSQSFDLVTACEVLEHLPVGVYERTLEQLEQVANKYVLVTVPNAENLNRGYLRCPVCGCSFHRNRHVRTYREESLRALLPTFFCIEVRPIGRPRAFYPGWAEAVGRALGALPRSVPGAPVCPQCGYAGFATHRAASNDATPRRPKGLRGHARRFVRPLIPKSVRRPWLAALFRRPS